MAARNTKRSFSMILRKNRGQWTVYEQLGPWMVMNGKRREIPVTPPERELQWCYYSPSIFLASSQTAPAP